MVRRLLALLLLLPLVAACAGSDVPPATDRNPSTADSAVAVTPAVQIADGASTIVVTATVRNASGAALAGIDVMIEPATGPWSLMPASGVATTAADGTAAFALAATQAGQHTVTLRAGSVALAPTAEFTFVAPLTLSGYGTSSALVGEEFAFVAQVGGGLAPFAFERTGELLPAGFTFDTATGELGGIPATATPFEGTVTVSDASGQSTSQAYRVEPIAPLPNAPVLQLKGQGRSEGTGSTATVDWPLRIADGDLVLVVVATPYPATHDVTGFTEIVRIPETNAMQVSAWYLLASGRPPGTAIEVTLGESVPYVIRSMRVSGQSTEAPIGASSVLYELNSGDGIVRLPGIRAGDSALLIGAAVYAGGDVTVEVPGGMTQAWQAVDPGLRLTTAGAFAQISAAGPTGDRVFKLMLPTGRRRSGILFEIRP